MEIITNYLIREKQLVLTAGLLGVASFAVGLLVLILATRYKSFSASLLILGALEAGVRITSYNVCYTKLLRMMITNRQYK